MRLRCVLETTGLWVVIFFTFGIVITITLTACALLAQWVSDTFIGEENIEVIMVLTVIFLIFAMSFETALLQCYFEKKEKAPPLDPDTIIGDKS